MVTNGIQPTGVVIDRLETASNNRWADITILIKAVQDALKWGPFESDPAGHFEHRLQILADILMPENAVVVQMRSDIFDILIPRTRIAELREALVSLRPSSSKAEVEAAKLALDDWLRDAVNILQGWDFSDYSLSTRNELALVLDIWRTSIYHVAAVDPIDPTVHLERRVTQSDASLNEIRLTQSEINKALAAAKSATGQTGEVLLSAAFGEDAVRDEKIATGLSVGAGAVLLSALGIGIWIVGGDHEMTIPLVIAKVGLTIPFLGLSAYLGRLANHYREAARWARTAAVQLRSIEPFVQGFDASESREEVRLVLGRRVFGDPGFTKSAKSMDTEDAVSIIDAIGRLPKPE
ncbi:hypothetical protein [Rhodococcoides fascians]|uniref:hypothetical protein n=1 Tax=Rhodococcoides fascians TaxID=1828 RepID=UPI0027812A21|nr:hypothetical protein [Rhodococcus fascians]MDQ0283774.1 hypothetical protein [Rhodococcus fascians]